MKIENVNEWQLEQALKIANRTFEDNILMYHDKRRDFYLVNLRVINSSGKGHALSSTTFNKDGQRRKLGSPLCWHGHGHFFDVLLTINPKAIITTHFSKKITIYVENGKIQGNWQDWLRGNDHYGYVMQSELCTCEGIPVLPENLEWKSGLVEWLEA